MMPAEQVDATDDAATVALWRAAENGDFGELVAILPSVADVNACNEHGVTALMRAAQQGHVRIVRALLEHGADANVKRNDKFTALALAAFFGHTDVVRTLMEYGADSHAATRNGTSPQMWATARTFNAVVKSLDKPKPAPQSRPVPDRVLVSTARPELATEAMSAAELDEETGSTVVRTLKDPPEIWDLVHEAPRNFNAGSAFVGRLNSMKTAWALPLLGAIVLGAVAVGSVMLLRNDQARDDQSIERPTQSVPQTAPPAARVQTESVTPTNNNSQASTAVQPFTPSVSSAVEQTPPLIGTSSDSSAPTLPQGARSSFVSSHRIGRGATRRVAAEDVVQSSVAASEKTETPARPRVVTTEPPTAAQMSPQMVAPPKSTAPKGKVIQWP